jgi:hypothetical protein
MQMVMCSNKKCRVRIPLTRAKEDKDTHALFCADCFDKRSAHSEDKPTDDQMSRPLYRQYWDIILRQKPRPV